MPNTSNTTIITYADFENIFRLGSDDIECLLYSKVKDFDPNNLISYICFLNMVCQTTPINELLVLQIWGEGRVFDRKHLVNLFIEPKVIYHRDNLLYLIIYSILMKINGNNEVIAADKKIDKDLYNFGQALLLINNKIGFIKYKNVVERDLVKFFPYHVPRTLYWFYKQRIMRYVYIYKNLLYKKTSNNPRDMLLKGIKLIEDKYNLKFNDYIDMIAEFFFWFLGMKERNVEGPKFDRNNKGSFFINKKDFENTKYMPIINALSKNIDEFYNEFKKTRKDMIDNEIFRYFQNIFDYPIFKINEDKYCVIDLKFLLESVCAGLIWKINSIIRNNKLEGYSIINIREQYGYLLEEYFVFLMKKMFPEIKITNKEEGEPDAILETEFKGKKYIVIFEFTVKYFRIASLYNASPTKFIKDILRILFNKEEKGKFIALNSYIEKYKKDNIEVLPILVTENWFGDYDLLNRFNSIISRKIMKMKLINLTKYKPTILCLDDLETLLGVSKNGEETNALVECIELWNKEGKNRFWFSFAYFVSLNRSMSNQKYKDFFDISNIDDIATIGD